MPATNFFVWANSSGGFRRRFAAAESRDSFSAGFASIPTRHGSFRHWIFSREHDIALTSLKIPSQPTLIKAIIVLFLCLCRLKALPKVVTLWWHDSSQRETDIIIGALVTCLPKENWSDAARDLWDLPRDWVLSPLSRWHSCLWWHERAFGSFF